MYIPNSTVVVNVFKRIATMVVKITVNTIDYIVRDLDEKLWSLYYSDREEIH